MEQKDFKTLENLLEEHKKSCIQYIIEKDELTTQDLFEYYQDYQSPLFSECIYKILNKDTASIKNFLFVRFIKKDVEFDTDIMQSILEQMTKTEIFDVVCYTNNLKLFQMLLTKLKDYRQILKEQIKHNNLNIVEYLLTITKLDPKEKYDINRSKTTRNLWKAHKDMMILLFDHGLEYEQLLSMDAEEKEKLYYYYLLFMLNRELDLILQGKIIDKEISTDLRKTPYHCFLDQIKQDYRNKLEKVIQRILWAIELNKKK